MCSPERFDVAYAINAHMTDAEGRLKTVDRAKAQSQWEDLRRAYEAIGYPVDVVPAVEGLPDMVFAANQSFPYLEPDGTPAVVLSRMRHAERRAEVPHFAAWYASNGYALRNLPEDVGAFEGGGDLLWVPGRRLLLGGYGFRTDLRALEAVAALIGADLVALKLVDPRFYHLDTALVPLDEERALFVEAAFEPAGRAALGEIFRGLLSAPTDEAAEKFACNAHCPDGRNALIDTACTATKKLLAERGFRVRPIDTSEFRKSGGSVFCLKTELPGTFGSGANSKANPAVTA